MSLGLATDVGNTNFVGATNPDAALFVEIYAKPLQNNFRTKTEGRPIFDDILMIKIHTPGNQLNIVDRMLFEEDKKRFPMHWAHFQNTHGKDGALSGTPVEQWPLITGATAEMLKAVGFKTVEQIALASDAQLQNMGLHGGMAPHALRERAKSFLQSAAGESATHALQEELRKRDQALLDLKAQQAADNERRDREMAELRAMIKPRGKPGRKPKHAEPVGP